MSDFKIGDKVVVVGNDPWLDINGKPIKGGPQLNKIYTVCTASHALAAKGRLLPFIELEEMKDFWCALWFRKVDDQFAENVLAEIEEQIAEEELVEA